MTRISLNLPNELLRELDYCLKEKGYHSRSKGIEDALRDYIICNNRDKYI